MANPRNRRLALALVGITFLSACEEGQQINLFGDRSGDTPALTAVTADGIAIEQDIESPEVFQQSDTGLWDGRPSLGGVWIAHSDVVDPERVMIRNEDNGKFIIGALFRRERENPGPRFQVSSDAAAELGMLAGAPSNLSVVALRRVEAPVAAPAAPAADVLALPEMEIATLDTIAPAETIEPTSIDPVAALAASAIEAATAANPTASLPAPGNAADAALAATPPSSAPLQATIPVAISPPPVAPQPVATPAPRSALEKPFVQIGIFSVESNANDTSALLRSSGIIPTIKISNSSGKTYWRVVVGPMGSPTDRADVIKKVKGLGFPDAYAVTN